MMGIWKRKLEEESSRVYSHYTYEIRATGFGEHSDERVKWGVGLKVNPSFRAWGPWVTGCAFP